MGKKRKSSFKDDDEYSPIQKRQTSHLKNQEKRLIIILEGAQLESVKVSFGFTNELYEIISSANKHYVFNYFHFQLHS